MVTRTIFMARHGFFRYLLIQNVVSSVKDGIIAIMMLQGHLFSRCIATFANSVDT